MFDNASLHCCLNETIVCFVFLVLILIFKKLYLDSNMSSSGKAAGVRRVSWRDKETADLIAIWRDARIQIALASSHKNIEVFEKVAHQMRALGYDRSSSECRTKTKALRAMYRLVVSHNKENGRAPATCPFF